MPLKLEKSDRRLLLWSGLTMLVVISLLAYFARPEEEPDIPSSYSARSGGAKAAFLLLQEAGYNAERWERQPQDLPTDSSSTVLVLAEPTVFLQPGEKDALEKFLDGGGTIVAAGKYVSYFLPD